jgi:hypothetical protein
MVNTRRTNAAANAEPAPARTTRATRKAAASQSASGEAEVAASTTTRRLRSKQTASPLKSLGEPKRTVPKPSAAKATVARATTTTTKRKRGASRATASPEPEPAKDDEEGLFFRSGTYDFFSTPVPIPLTRDSSSADMEDVSVEAPLSPQWEPTWERLAREREEEIVQVILSSSSPEVIIIALRKDIFKLRAQVTGLQHLEVQNQDLLAQNRDLLLSNTHLRTLLEMLRTGQVQANSLQLDIDSFGIPAEPPSPAQPEFFVGDEAALALLRKIEAAARAPPIAPPDENRETEAQTLPQPTAQEVAQSENSQAPADATPSRPINEPSGFFSRSFTAIKTRLGFTPTPTTPSPTTPSSSRTPPPGSFTEVLSTPPTPVGERSKARPRKKKTSPMLRLLLKGVEASDMTKAETWAKHAIPAFMNLSNYEAKRRLLETPVLVQDLEHLPSCKPWESGFGDPLGELDDEELAPVWAVYLQILAQEEEPRKKKSKSSHRAAMDVDFAQSLDETSADAIAELRNGSQSPLPKLHNSHGNSASHLDLEPRRSVQPSPMFGSSSSHQEGVNVFNELQGHDSTLQLQTNDRQNLIEATNKVTNHNPSEGSYGLDYGSDEDDSSILSETSEGDAGTSLWTQPPPPAPVPAHAPLPGGLAAETSSVPTSQEPVDEVARQRQKLMKHTPAKPSRLREAFVPSPSVRSDAGNDSLFLATPLAAPDTFDDMPGAEDLGLTSEEWAAVDDLRNSEAFLAADASIEWPDAILTYSSDEEDLSPI